MAVIEDLGIEVSIMIDGKPVPEYADTEPDLEETGLGPNTRTSHCYIESRNDVHFAISAKVVGGANPAASWVNKKRNHVMSFDPSFDGGECIQGFVLREVDKPFNDQGVCDWAENTIQKYRFSAVSTMESADNQRVTDDMEKARHLGLLRINVMRTVVAKAQHTSETDRQNTTGPSEAELTLAEKVLKGKALSLCASLSAPVEQTDTKVELRVHEKDDAASPFAVFFFKYRTKEELQKAMIIPRSRAPSLEPAIEVKTESAIKTPNRQISSSEAVVGEAGLLAPEGLLRLSDEALQRLPFGEALRLAEERLKNLPLVQVLGLAGEAIQGLSSIGQVLQLASQKLKDMPCGYVLRLAGERLEEKTNELKREGDEASRLVPHSMKTTQSMKRELEEEPRSGRPSKHRRTKGRMEAIDLTGDVDDE